MKNEDLATAFGAAVMVGLLGTVVVVAVFGPSALRGMFGQTGAAWAQAVGTVGAVVAAVWISRQELRRRHDGAVRTFEFVRALLQQKMALCHMGTTARSKGIIDDAHAGLREAYSLSCAIDLGELDQRRAMDLVRIRSELSQLFVSIEAVKNAQGMLDTIYCWNNLDASLGRVIETLDLPTTRSGL